MKNAAHLLWLVTLLAADGPARLGAALGFSTTTPETVGGMAYLCVLLGIATGLAFVSGNVGGVLGGMVAADTIGCF